MSLQPTDPRYVPSGTARIARAAFPKGNLAMSLRTELERLYTNELFADLYAKRGKPAEAPWRLALVTVLQFAEELSDREAATAVKARLDWKFTLGLELSDTGFEHAVLSKFRTQLIAGNAEHRLLDVLLEVCKAKGLIRKRGQARTDSTHVLAKVRALNRIGSCVESMRATLNAVATVAPEWLSWVPGSWFERYGPRYDDFRLPKGVEQLNALAVQVGEDGCLLLQKLAEADALAELVELPAAAGLALLGEGSSPKGLLPPRVVGGVRYVRISQHPNFVTQVLSHPGAVERLEVTLTTTRNNLRQHELYATTYDPKREQIEAEIKALKEALAFVRASPKETFRFRMQVVRIRPYIYP